MNVARALGERGHMLNCQGVDHCTKQYPRPSILKIQDGKGMVSPDIGYASHAGWVWVWVVNDT